jgi:NAD(P)-dependent dehydrogenase (short-subunit alcohol dehydrogenase family)
LVAAVARRACGPKLFPSIPADFSRVSARRGGRGITTTIVNSGFFRTELLSERSTNYAEPSIEDYDDRRAKQLEFWKAQNSQQSGDPDKLARALVVIPARSRRRAALSLAPMPLPPRSRRSQI